MWYIFVSHYIGPGVALQRGWRECENEEQVRDAIAEVLERGVRADEITVLCVSEPENTMSVDEFRDKFGI